MQFYARGASASTQNGAGSHGSPVQTVIDRLTRQNYDPRPAGAGKWESRCPVHKGSRRNLSITEGTDGAALLRCHHIDEAGQNCPVPAIIAELGLELKDLFVSVPGSRRAAGPKKKAGGFSSPREAAEVIAKKLKVSPSAQWIYNTRERAAYAAVYRFDTADGKEYRPVSVEPATNQWVIKDPPGGWLPYRVDEIVPADRVFFLEGEKCVDLACGLGLAATTTAHGAQSPHKTDLSALASKDVVVVPDAGAPGEGYAGKLVELLSKLTPPPVVKVLRLPGLADGEDIEQWIQARSDTPPAELGAELVRLAVACPVEKGFVGSVGDPPQDSPIFEGEPAPLTTHLLPVPPFPLELIPAPLRGWLANIAKRGCFPIEYPVASAVVALSSLIGRNLAIRPKRRDEWTVVPNLWGADVGPPGIQKTPSVEETLLPLRRLIAEAIEDHARAEQQAMEDASVSKAKAEAAKKKLAEAARKGAPDATLRALAAEANQAGEAEEPTAKRYLVNDATVEKLGELLRENPRGLLQFRDELTGFFRSMDRQGHESDRGFYLECWNGDGSYTFDRIGRGTVHIPALCLSLFGTIQPGPLSRYLKGSAAGDEADGFMPRFQILVYPDTPAKFVNFDEWPDVAAKNAAYEVFRRIDSMNPTALGAELDEDRGLSFLRFDDDAQELFDEWRTDLENRLRGGSESALMTCHLAKFRSLMPSLALVFHVVASVGSDSLDPVTLQAAQAAAAWCDVLEAHARRIYQCAVEGDPEAAARLGERIKQSLPNPFTFRQVAIKGWAGLDIVEDVRKAVNILEDRNWAKVVERRPVGGGRPSEEVWINPAIRNGEGAKP